MFLGSRKSLVIAGGVLLTLGLIGSRAKAEIVLPDPNNCPNLEYTIETDKAIYQLGEQVHIVQEYSNLSDDAVTFIFYQSPGFDMWVLKGADVIWHQVKGWQNDIAHPTLSAGESFRSEYSWGMVDDNGNPVAPGEYEVLGVMVGGPDPAMAGCEYPAAPSTTITIIPEPTTLVSLLVGLGLTSMRKRRWITGMAQRN